MKRKTLLVRQYAYPEKENTLENKLKACGWNTGNIVWYEGVKGAVAYDYEIYVHDSLGNTDGEEGETTYICPMANILRLDHRGLDFIAEKYLESDTDRIVMIGLGANLTSEVDTPRKLMDLMPKERVRAMQKIGERSVSIGVRGEFTAECLELIGVNNYRIIGCPSFYSDPEAIYSVCDGKNYVDGKWNINLSAYGSEGISRFLDILEGEGKFQESIYSLQDMADFPKTIYEDMPILDRHMKARFPHTNISAKKFTQYVRQSGRMFFDINEWEKSLLGGYNLFCRSKISRQYDGIIGWDTVNMDNA